MLVPQTAEGIRAWLGRLGEMDDAEMFRVFNMGIGYVLAVRSRSTAAVVRTLEKAGQPALVIGRVKRGNGSVEFR